MQVLSKHVEEVVSIFQRANKIICYKKTWKEDKKLIFINSKNYLFSNSRDIIFELSDNKNIKFEDLEFAESSLSEDKITVILGNYEFELVK